jgi:TRAP-type C4-dicarboxylate transport system permease small subunit
MEQRTVRKSFGRDEIKSRLPDSGSLMQGVNQVKNKLTPKKILANLDIAVTCIIMVILVVLTFGGVIFRYILNKPFIWMEEVQLMCMVWIVYGAAGAAFRLHSHVAIEVLFDFLPRRLRNAAQALISLVILCVASYFFIQSIGYVQLFIMNGRGSGILQIPYKYVYAIVPFSAVLMVGNYFFSLVSSYKNDKRGE